MIIERGDKKYEIVIGAEVHVQLSTKSKLFSSGRNYFSDQPNHNVHAIDLGMPGVLPVLNASVGKLAAMVGFGVKGQVQKVSRFDRKHYFYPDLPQGYQISQFYHPIVLGGHLEVWGADGEVKTIGIERIHIEQDAGKLVHDKSQSDSMVDYNRAGIPLLEIVSAPDLRSPQEAMNFLREIRMILRTVGASEADMEKGSFRCDANVSVRELGSEKFGIRCEIKNLNSFRFVGRAIEYEANRQVDILCAGGVVEQQTRLFDTDTGATFAMRDKEGASDYRYFPDPDLPELVFKDGELEEIQKSMPKMHYDRRSHYVESLGLSRKEANDVIAESKYVEYFEHLLEAHEAKYALGWVMSDLVGSLKKLGKELEDCTVTKEELAQLLGLVKSEEISGKMAKEVLVIMLEEGKSPSQIVQERGLKQVTDSGQLEEIILNIIKNNTSEVEQYKSGNARLMAFFVGRTMKETGGKANPAKVNELIKKHLG